MGRSYLDWNATTPLRGEAREAMISAMDHVGNPSSVHGEGRGALGIVARARRQVAEAFGADGADVILPLVRPKPRHWRWQAGGCIALVLSMMRWQLGPRQIWLWMIWGALL